MSREDGIIPKTLNSNTILQKMQEHGVQFPQRVWDYRLYGPSSLDDTNEMYLDVTEALKDGEDWKPGARVRYVLKFELTSIASSELSQGRSFKS